MSRSKSILEQRLPPEFLYDLGLYLQTCAHIELLACALVCELEGLRIQTPEWRTRHLKLRKMRSSQLLEVLGSCAKRDEVAQRIDTSILGELVAWMKVYIQNRHIAAHGAFFLTPDGHLRVNYLHPSEGADPADYDVEKATVTRELADELIEDASRIHLSLWTILKAAGATDEEAG